MPAADDSGGPAVSRSRLTLRADWPFAVGRAPFFYGWVVWFVSTVGFLMSIPGQTMGMAVFTDVFIEAFGLSRTQLSTAYFFGTIGSALFLTRAGRWYDRLGARALIVASSVLLGVVTLLISSIDVVAGALAGFAGIAIGWFAFPLVLCGYFGVRFMGQGILTSASRNVLLGWFERRRGLVSGVRGIFVSLGFSLAPLGLALMIDSLGWREALWALAAIVGVVFAGTALLLVRDSPEQCGLLPDGAAPRNVAHAHAAASADRSLSQARGSPVFWIYSASLSIHALFGTAVTFHIVDIFSEAGRGRDEAFGYFLPAALVSTSVNLVASAVADMAPLKPFLIGMLCAFCVGATGLMFLDSAWGYWMLVAGFGAGGGLWGVLSNLAFVRYFGRLHLGEISGLNTSLTVLASALGPIAFSMASDWFGTYRWAEAFCVALILVLLVAAIVIRQDDMEMRLP